jgi:hypothetical protein
VIEILKRPCESQAMSETIVETQVSAPREDAKGESKEEDDKPTAAPPSEGQRVVDEDDPPPSDDEEDPTTIGGKLKPDASGAGAALRPKQWLDVNFEPHPNDVLCGRGKSYREWPGNERFRIVVEAHLDEYKVAIGRSEKGVILTRVVEAVRNQEGATGFLKQGTFCSSVCCFDAICPRVLSDSQPSPIVRDF